MTYNEVIVPKCVGIAFLIEVVSDRHLIVVAFIYRQEEAARGCIEPKNVVHHSPHVWIKEPPRLAKDGGQILPSPLKRALVPRDTKRHFGVEDAETCFRRSTRCSCGIALEKTQKVGVICRVEDYL